MRGWVIIVAFFGGLFALCWYGVTGETGPMGWLNSWQNGHTGSYSRGLSFAILCVGAVVIAAPLLGLWSVVARKSRASSGASPVPLSAPADAKIAAMAEALSDRSRWRWRMYLAVWLVGVALIWAVVLGWRGWDFHRRASDASSDYTLLRLGRTAPVAKAADGSHWALQGRLLWDRSVTQKSKNRATQTETVYVPVAGADWRPGDAVQFFVRLPGPQVWALQRRSAEADAPLRVRVDGAIPTAARAVFQRAEVPPLDDAVQVEVVEASTGQAGASEPRFDGENAKLIGLAVSATWTAGLWLGALAVLVKVWHLRRRRAPQQA